MAIICFNKRKNGDFWFRIFGYGLSFYNEPMFSDRYFKRRKFLGYYIQILKP